MLMDGFMINKNKSILVLLLFNFSLCFSGESQIVIGGKSVSLKLNKKKKLVFTGSKETFILKGSVVASTNLVIAPTAIKDEDFEEHKDICTCKSELKPIPTKNTFTPIKEHFSLQSDQKITTYTTLNW